MLDMIFTLLKNKSKISFIIIDTYSGWSFYYVLIIGALSQFYEIKYIPFLHGGNLETRLKNNSILSNFIFSNSYINISPSSFHENNFKRYGYDCITIPNVINLSKYPFKERKVIKSNLLWVRSFQNSYNPLLALKIVKGLIDEGYTKTSLTMVGPAKDSSFEECIEYIKYFSLENHISILGLKTKDEWIKLSKNKDIFINTTNVDNTPVSVIEAMALGMIVISTNVGGIPNIINGKNGILVSPRNEKDFINQILLLIKNKNTDYSMNAREYSLKYDKNRVLEKWNSIFNEDFDLFFDLNNKSKY
jgi:glycosyltransferase involved in cell wall biosynthesis